MTFFCQFAIFGDFWRRVFINVRSARCAVQEYKRKILISVTSTLTGGIFVF